MNDDTKIRRRLEEERARLESMRAGLAREAEQDVAGGGDAGELSSLDQHDADVASDVFEREKDVSILEHIDSDLAAVAHALQRLDDGDYGRCEVCGRDIGAERLDAMPTASLCLEHQQQAERAAR